MPIYDYVCKNYHKFEKLTPLKYKDTPVPCLECGEPSHTVISPVTFILEGISGDFPTASDKWAQRHNKAGKQ